MLNKIVSLDDGHQFCILHEIIYEGKKYCVALDYLEDSNDVGDEYFVFEENFDNNNVTLIPVDDDELKEYLFVKIGIENDENSDN